MAAKYDSEATGIDKKADAMKKFNDVGREHEEFKMRLGKDERIALAGIDVNRQIAEAQAQVPGEEMKSANIDIVGGDGQFLKTFFRSISLAKSLDGFVDNSEQAKAFVGDEAGGILQRLKDLVSEEGLNPEDIKNLTISGLLGRLALKSDNPDVREEAEGLKGVVKKMGLEDLVALWLAK